MTQAQPVTIRHGVVVNAPLERAFTVFTARFGDFKPREHNLLSVPIAEPVFEARVGGHIWDIGPTWQLESDLNRASEVEVRFTAESDHRTRVELEHRYIERHGEGWESVAAGVDGDAGWPLYLVRYANLFTQ
jgi:hypothetical protein